MRRDRHVLIFVVARTRLDRYEDLRRQFEDSDDVRVVLDRREGERRTSHGTFGGAERRGPDRRRRDEVDAYRRLGWSMIDTDEVGFLEPEI